jgi:DNA polymerase III beta subunit
MKFSAERETILAPLQAVIGVVERRQTMPILANVLVVGRGEQLSITATDLEVELVARTNVSLQQAGEVTLPGRKLLDIVRALPEKTQVTVSIEGEKATIRSGKSRFTLATLPASDFPTVEDIRAQQTLTIAQPALKRLLDKTHFSMAQQDVRYYLNGMLLESDGKTLRTVATDGHRLAFCESALDSESASSQQVIYAYDWMLVRLLEARIAPRGLLIRVGFDIDGITLRIASRGIAATRVADKSSVLPAGDLGLADPERCNGQSLLWTFDRVPLGLGRR